MGAGKSSDFTETGYQPAGIYGWRKQCLYATVLFILIIVVMNLALTVWILRVLDFSIDGLHLGQIKLLDDGVQVTGEVDIDGTLYTPAMKSPQNKPFTIDSHRDIVLRTRHTDTKTVSSQFRIGKNKIEGTCKSFEIIDPVGGKTRFKVTDKEVVYGVDEVTYSGKAVFNGSIETPNIRGPLKGSLKLESASSSILLSGKGGVQIDAPEGDILMKSSQDIIFQSDRKINITANNIFMKNIDIITARRNGKGSPDVYQLCMCSGSGRLFLAPSSGQCVTDKTICT